MLDKHLSQNITLEILNIYLSYLRKDFTSLMKYVENRPSRLTNMGEIPNMEAICIKLKFETNLSIYSKMLTIISASFFGAGLINK